MDCNVTESVSNPIGIYEFYENSLWLQLIANGTKASFMGHITDSEGWSGSTNAKVLVVRRRLFQRSLYTRGLLLLFLHRRVEKREEVKGRYGRIVLCDEYRINGVNAMCKRAIAPTVFPFSLSLSLSLSHFLSISRFFSILFILQVIVCLLLASSTRLKGRRIAEEARDGTRVPTHQEVSSLSEWNS